MTRGAKPAQSPTHCLVLLLMHCKCALEIPSCHIGGCLTHISNTGRFQQLHRLAEMFYCTIMFLFLLYSTTLLPTSCPFLNTSLDCVFKIIARFRETRDTPWSGSSSVHSRSKEAPPSQLTSCFHAAGSYPMARRTGKCLEKLHVWHASAQGIAPSRPLGSLDSIPAFSTAQQLVKESQPATGQ